MMNYPVPIRSGDGYTFYVLEDGRVVDNLDPELEDMSWPDLASFTACMNNASTQAENNTYRKS